MDHVQGAQVRFEDISHVQLQIERWRLSDYRTCMQVINVDHKVWQTQDASWRMYLDMSTIVPKTHALFPIMARFEIPAPYLFNKTHQLLKMTADYLDMHLNWEGVFGPDVDEATGFARCVVVDCSSIPTQDR